MIDVYIDNNSNEHCIELTGHALFNDEGKDIVCASATILAYSLARELTILESKGHCTLTETTFDKGHICIKCTFSKSKECKSAFNLVIGGLQILHTSFQENLCISHSSVL